MQSDKPSPYDDIMRLLHDAKAFAEVHKQPTIAVAARHVCQIAETEFLYEASCYALAQQP